VLAVDCYYSLSSPWAYFAGPRLVDIVRRHHARLTLKPYDFQRVAPESGGVPIRTRPEPRRRYHEVELDRRRRHLGMPLQLRPGHYPFENPPPGWNEPAGWMVIAAQERGLDAPRLSHAILRALWAEDRDIADAGTRRAIAAAEGMDGAALVEAERSAAVRTLYARYTEEALARGVFGAPTFVFEDVLYWGQDRLDFLDRALAAARARAMPGAVAG
jgi:2-hydroxychromene-2-carboxylate isomerase